MYKIVSFRYESVIQKKFARRKIFFCPPNHKSVPTALVNAHIIIYNSVSKLYLFAR